MKLSIIIKAYNEAHNIERAIQSALKAAQFLGDQAEILLADSLSIDHTVELAKAYPIKIVQLVNPRDRSCGVGAQLGYQLAQGEFVYILDADMEFIEGFLEVAIHTLENNPKLAGVAGLVQEMNTTTLEFQERYKRKNSGLNVGLQFCLSMGGLYKKTALKSVGYFTHRNLRSYEELELGARLMVKGWQLERINVSAIKHYGHQMDAFKLLLKRFSSGYTLGVGELIRSAIGKPHLKGILIHLKNIRLYLVYIVWIKVLFLLLILNTFKDIPWSVTLMFFLMPFVGMIALKKSFLKGIYAVCASILASFGMVLGVLKKQPNGPMEPFEYRVIKK